MLAACRSTYNGFDQQELCDAANEFDTNVCMTFPYLFGAVSGCHLRACPAPLLCPPLPLPPCAAQPHGQVGARDEGTGM